MILMIDGHNSYICANHCTVFNALHAIFASMRIRMCLEYYVRCVHMTNRHNIFGSVAVIWWEL